MKYIIKKVLELYGFDPTKDSEENKYARRMTYGIHFTLTMFFILGLSCTIPAGVVLFGSVPAEERIASMVIIVALIVVLAPLTYAIFIDLLKAMNGLIHWLLLEEIRVDKAIERIQQYVWDVRKSKDGNYEPRNELSDNIGDDFF